MMDVPPLPFDEWCRALVNRLRELIPDVKATRSRAAVTIRRPGSQRVPTFGAIELRKLTPAMVQHGVAGGPANPAGARTREPAFVVLRAALDVALRWNLIMRNPAALAETPRARSRRRRVLGNLFRDGPQCIFPRSDEHQPSCVAWCCSVRIDAASPLLGERHSVFARVRTASR